MSNMVVDEKLDIIYFYCKECGELIVTYYKESMVLESTNSKFVNNEEGGVPFTTVDNFKCNNCGTINGYMRKVVLPNELKDVYNRFY